MGMGTGPGRTNRFHSAPFTEINVTPFVDVMLVLLVIFMVTAPMMTSGVSVDLPDSAAKALPGQDEPLDISITGDGKIYIKKTEVQLSEVQPKLAAIAGEKKETRIFVRGDKSADYGSIMKVVGEINAAGFNKVALVTETGAPPANSTASRHP